MDKRNVKFQIQQLKRNNMIKWTQLSKKNIPDFDEEVLIWTSAGYTFMGKRTSTTETPDGLKHIFQCGTDGKSSEVENATHYSTINGPKEKE